jgi:uncharacterized protein YkwD
MASLAACGGGGGSAPGPSPLTTIPSNTSVDTSLALTVPTPDYGSNTEKLAVFEQLNADRLACGFGKLAQNAKIDVAAQGHADYSALNHNPATHYQTAGLPGFTGVGPVERVAAAGFRGSAGEVLSPGLSGPWFHGTGVVPYPVAALPAKHALRRLYASIYHLQGLMSGAREFGIGVASFTNHTVYGDANFKMLVIDYGTLTGQANQLISSDALAMYPCQGSANVMPLFTSESPDPFPNSARDFAPYGQPVYLAAAKGATLSLSTGSITLHGGAAVPTVISNKANDPNPSFLGLNEVFLTPTQGLKDNSVYDVVLTGTNSGMVGKAGSTKECTYVASGAFTCAYSFTTGTYVSDF